MKGLRLLIVFASVVLLLLTQARLPIGYYTFLRIALCAGTCYLFWDAWRTQRGAIVKACFALIAILYNPIIPVHLGSKAAWWPVNLATVLVLLVIGPRWKRKTNPESNRGGPIN